MIRAYFGGVGSITKQSKDSVQFRVNSLKDLAVVIDHFAKCPLITQKRADFELLKQVVEIMNRKEHLTLDGLYKIVSLRAAMNNGLSEKQKAAFPDVVPVQRPLVLDQEIPDPHWLSGFVSAEGCFFIVIQESTSHKAGVKSTLRFQIGQHSRDAELMKNIQEYFDCGNFRLRANQDAGDFLVTRFVDIHEKIIPFFSRYPIVGIKALDYGDFCKAAELMKTKAHLTKHGLEQIRKIKDGMNKGR